MALLSSVFTGLALANGNYGIAALNFFCVYLNINSYNKYKEREVKELDIK
jgi:hypothetical protein